MSIIQEGNHLQFTHLSIGKPSLTVDHLCIFTDRHSVCNGNRVHSNKRFVLCLQDRTIDKAIGIRAVEDDEFLFVFGTGLHQVMERADVGIKTTTTTLYVED